MVLDRIRSFFRTSDESKKNIRNNTQGNRISAPVGGPNPFAGIKQKKTTQGKTPSLKPKTPGVRKKPATVKKPVKKPATAKKPTTVKKPTTAKKPATAKTPSKRRPINEQNRNALKRENPNKATNINMIYKYPYLHSVVNKTNAQRNINIQRARTQLRSTRTGRSENAFNPALISDETLNYFISLVNDYKTFKDRLPSTFNKKPYDQLLRHYNKIYTHLKDYKYSELSKPLSSRLYALRTLFLEKDQIDDNDKTENKAKVYDIFSLCSKNTFIILSGRTTNMASNGDVGLHFETLSLRINDVIKDLDAVKAITHYLHNKATNNSSSRLNSFESYISTLSKNSKNTINIIPNDLRKLIGSFRILYKSKRIHGMTLSLESGPADHNSLSNRSLQDMVSNPNTFEAFNPRSLFLHFVWNAIKKHGTNRSDKCGFRGKIDDALLRRRVVFANVGQAKTLGYRTFAQALIAMNHGRTHKLKTLVRGGNKSIGIPRNMITNKNSKSYVNAMKNKNVRNETMFLNTEKRTDNHLYDFQVGSRIALRFDGTKLVKFSKTNDKEKPNVLWTTYGLHMYQTSGSKSYKFFDLLKYLYGDKTNINPINNTGIGRNYVIQLDSATLTWLHEKYYFTDNDRFGEDYRTQIITKITSCTR